MKIRPEHLKHLKALIQPLDTPNWRQACIAGNLSDMRYRWDLFSASGALAWACRGQTLYSYLNDDHIDTALRSIVPPLNPQR